MKKLLRFLLVTSCLVMAIAGTVLADTPTPSISVKFDGTINKVCFDTNQTGTLYYEFQVKDTSGNFKWASGYDTTAKAYIVGDTEVWYTSPKTTALIVPTAGLDVKVRAKVVDKSNVVLATSDLVSFVSTTAIAKRDYPSVTIVEKSVSETTAVLTATLDSRYADSNLMMVTVTNKDGDVLLKKSLSSVTASIDVTVKSNGVYTFKVEADSLLGYTENYTLSSINKGSSDAELVIPVEDKVPPVIVYDGIPATATLGDLVTLNVRTNEKCDINIEGSSFLDTDSADFIIYNNGTYDIIATDVDGNKSTASVVVDCFKQVNDTQIFGTTTFTAMKTGILPQTGGFYIVISIVVAVPLIVIGVLLFIFSSKKKKLTDSIIEDTAAEDDSTDK